MIFYLIVFCVIFLFTTGKYKSIKSLIAHFILFFIIAAKGEVGCDYTGYYNRYIEFNPNNPFSEINEEHGWYLVEYFTNIYNLEYQTYTIVAATIGLSFLFFAQKKIKYIGFLFFIYQMIIVQLGLSGVRQFIAVCILTYAIAIYLFENQKSILKFLILIGLAASFHTSVLAMIFILPFIHKLKKSQYILIIIVVAIALSSEIINSASEKYEERYLEDITRISAGAWYRFIVSSIIGFFSIKGAQKRVVNMGIVVFLFGLFLGVVNSIALHRFNYYFLAIFCLLLIKNYKLGNINTLQMNYVYVLSVFYFLFWFIFSTHSHCFIPYNFFFQ